MMRRCIYIFIFVLGLELGLVHYAQATSPKLTRKSIEGGSLLLDNLEDGGIQKTSGMAKEMHRTFGNNSSAQDCHETFAFQVAERHSQYIAYVNGIVLDTKKGLEWFPGPDEDTNWDEAKSWVRNLEIDGGGWRMPTLEELVGLYKKGAEQFNMTPLLKTSGWRIWSGKTYGTDGARGLNFKFSCFASYRASRCYSADSRVFAVRSRTGGSFSGEKTRLENEVREFQKKKDEFPRKQRYQQPQRTQSGHLKGRLYVEMTPEFATVRILNTDAEFSEGMVLDPGSYHVEVSADGHETKELWVDLKPGKEKTLKFNLGRVSNAVASVQKTSTEASLRNSLGMEFVYIPSGSFIMGSPSEEMGRDSDEQQHRVTLTKGFYIQKTEITQGQWGRVMGNNPSIFANCGQDCPVEWVSWNDCRQFIRKLNQMERTTKYRLPTEAEWEYACRASTSGTFAGNLDTLGWYVLNTDVKTHPVSGKQPNAWGLYDMHGDVCEWCQDWYGQYPSNSVSNPVGASSSPGRVYRGGSFSSDVRACRSADRKMSEPEKRYINLGFRLAFSSVGFGVGVGPTKYP